MKINPKFQALIPPLAPEELAQLEANILKDGCRDPLAVWWPEAANRYCKECRKDIEPRAGDGIWECPSCGFGVDQLEEEVLLDGHSFQDFIMERSARIGMILNPYCSREGQRLGENLLGMEIKRDGEYLTTGNLYIEYAEKARPREGDYVPSGIMRSDNSWLFGIGDELKFWIFPISILRYFYTKRDEMRLREVKKPTSLGYLLPIYRADKFCARRLDFDFEGNISEVLNGNEVCEIDLAPAIAVSLPPQFQFRF